MSAATNTNASATGTNSATPKNQAQTETQNQAADSTDVGSTQTDAPAPTGSDHAAVRAPELSTASSTVATGTSNTQASAGAKTDAGNVANFGFSALAAAMPSGAAGSTSSTASTAAAVPVAGLAVAIAARAQAGSNQFDIRLDPPELGRIDVRLDVDSDGQVTTHMTAERADTLELLQNQQPQLEQALNQAGLKTADNGLQFSLRDQTLTGQNQSFTGQNNGSGSQTGNAAQLVIPDANLTPSAATQIYARAGLGSGIDIRI